MRKLQVFGVKACIFIFAFIFCFYFVSAIRINEVMADPSDNPSDEWIEIYNPEKIEINLTKLNLVLSDNFSTIKNFSINSSEIINDTYFLIIGRNFNLSNDFSNITYFKVSEVLSGGYFLKNGNYSLRLYYTNLSYEVNYSSQNGKSFQFCNGTWIWAEPTPGFENNCSQKSECIPNWTCTNWSTCINGIQTRNCTDLNGCENLSGKPKEIQDCDEEQTLPEIYLELEYQKEVENKNEFEVEVNAYNLKNESYDIKVWIEFNDSIISETYHEKDDKWKGGNYYVNNLFYGPGNETETLKLRIKEKYEDIYGNAKIKARIRKTDGNDYVSEIEEEIEILEKNEEIKKEKIEENEKTNKMVEEETEGIVELKNQIIKLNNPKHINTQNYVYKSKTQLIREYAIYGFSLFCIFVIIVLLIKRF